MLVSDEGMETVVAVAEVLAVGSKDKAGITGAAADVDLEGATVGGTAIARASAVTGVVVMVLVVVDERAEVVPAVEEELDEGGKDEAGVTRAADVSDMDGTTTPDKGAEVVVVVREAPPKQ